jgi:prefoldin alpha subunit
VLRMGSMSPALVCICFYFQLRKKEEKRRANGIKGKTLLVPLTASLYVPGKLSDMEHVLVDVGTGYYVEKSTVDAIKFYEAKVDTLGQNLLDLEKIVAQKGQNVKIVEEVLRTKVLAGSNNAMSTVGSAGSPDF